MISNQTIARAYMIFSTIAFFVVSCFDAYHHDWVLIGFNVGCLALTYFIMRSDL